MQIERKKWLAIRLHTGKLSQHTFIHCITISASLLPPITINFKQTEHIDL